MPAFRWQQAGRTGGRSLEEEKLIMTLQDAKVGTRVTVRRINGEGAYKRRIMDMGITKAARSIFARWPPWATRWKLPCADMSCRCARRTPPAWTWSR